LRVALGTLLLLFGIVALAQSYGPLPPAPAASPTSPAGTTATLTPSAAPTAAPPIPAGYRVRIARLRIDLPIAEGDVQRDVDLQRTPEGYAFHLPGTAIPGHGGNAYLYAHARSGMFLALWDARPGDLVVIVTPDGGELAYVVAEIRPRVDPSDVSVAEQAGGERVTLQTSTGPSPEDPRFVVIARPQT